MVECNNDNKMVEENETPSLKDIDISEMNNDNEMITLKIIDQISNESDGDSLQNIGNDSDEGGIEFSDDLLANDVIIMHENNVNKQKKKQQQQSGQILGDEVIAQDIVMHDTINEIDTIRYYFIFVCILHWCIYVGIYYKQLFL